MLNITKQPVARPYWVSARERTSTRTMLLDTAQALIARDGEDALTLGAIADEAGLARATIYGYFSGKRDLLAALKGASQAMQPAPAIALVAEAAPSSQPVFEPLDQQTEPVAEVAQIMVPEVNRPFEPDTQAAFAFSVEPASAQNDNLAEKIEEPIPTLETVASAEPVAMPEVPAQQVAPGIDVPGEIPPETASPVAEVHAPAETGDPDVIVTDSEVQDALVTTSYVAETIQLTPYEQERRLQAAHLEEIAKRLILPESALKEGTDAMISRLETRLRVLERSIAGLETRQNSAPDEAAKTIKPVSELVTQLQTRADAMEDRQRQALAELRLSIHELTARQSTLSAGTNSVPEMPAGPGTDASSVKAEEPSAQKAGPETSAEQFAGDGIRSAYLSTARNLAKEGARQAAERENQIEEDQRRRRLQLMTAAAVAGLCLVAVGVLFALRPGAHGVSTAQAKSGASAGQHFFAASTPLDRLTALAYQGDARAELVVGLKYLKGDGVRASDKDAAQWFARSAKAGNAVAENHLGALYQAGRGVPADMTEAIRWYTAAAMQGDRHAMSNLAVLYAGGSGGPKNFSEAARWFQRSAELGYVDAQFNLAVLFERGDGVPQSLLDAYKWYSIAAASGDPVAKTRAEAIATQVSPAELEAAKQEAANFTPRPLDHAANDVPALADVLASR